MSSGAVSAPLPITVEPLGFPDLWGVVRRFVARALMSERDRRLIDAIRQATDEIGPPLLASRDMADFAERLDAALECQALSKFKSHVVDRLVDEPESLSLNQSSSPWSPELFGGAVSKLNAVDRLIIEFAAAQNRFMSSLPAAGRIQAAQYAEMMAERPLGFLEDPTLHPTVKEMLLKSARADTCFMAVTYALMAHRRPEPWLSMALADIMLDGLYQQLRLLASIPAADVPTDVVPMADRLDAATIECEVQTTEAWLREFAAGADTDDVFPFSRPDD